jgi:hypothetical protein
MSYKPDEGTLMTYLYGELENTEREKVERYLFENPQGKIELEKLQQVRHIMGKVRDKEVIAPPIVIDGHVNRFNWNSPYLKTVFAIAASLLLIMVIGNLTNTNISFGDRQLKISFGKVQEDQQPLAIPDGLTATEVQHMINSSLSENNESLKVSWNETQEKLDASIRHNLTQNSNKIDNLVKQASLASQDQIKDFLSTAQTENMRLVKDYFQLTSGEQKKYIEDLLVDFAQYLQQQRTDDLKVVQSRLNNIEQNSDMFKQETEQILSSIISNTNPNSIMNKN